MAQISPDLQYWIDAMTPTDQRAIALIEAVSVVCKLRRLESAQDGLDWMRKNGYSLVKEDRSEQT